MPEKNCQRTRNCTALSEDGGRHRKPVCTIFRKVYLIGKDVQQDKELAYDYFLKSAEQGNIYAAYFLEHWNDMPYPDLFLMATRLMRHLEHIMGENVAGRKSGGSRQGLTESWHENP